MFVREENLEQFLSEPYTTSFDLAYLKTDLNDTPTLQAYKVIYAWWYQSGAHEFLMLHLTYPSTSINPPKKDIWMRIERMPRFPRALSLPWSQRFPANDIYSMNYIYGVVLKGELDGLQAVAALGQLSGLSISHVVELSSVIREVCDEWASLDTNSRWFCATTLRALEDRFGGIWMLGGSRDGLLELRAEEGRPAQMVLDRYRSNNHNVHTPSTAPAAADPGSGPQSNLNSKPGLSRDTNRHDTVLTAMSTRENTFTSAIGGETPAPAVQRGTMGLQTLGNTCFMNSALQCLAHIPELEEYFLSGLYKHDLNRGNPLGVQGQIVGAFSDLLNHLYPSPNPYTTRPATRNSELGDSANTYEDAPKIFKETFERFAPALSGRQQHDAQEFLAVLLDGLHKDLNRSLNEPHIEKPEWPEEGGYERAVAKETWEGYKKSNDSIIVDLFQGMYKSTLVCPECSKVSITFDPFMYLTLPIPSTKTWRHVVHWVPWDTRKTPLAVEIEVPKDSSYGYLKKLFGRWFGVQPENLLAAEVWSHKFYKFYEDYMNLTELAKKDTLVVYELPVPIKSIAKPPPPTSHFTFGSEPKPPPKSDPNAPFLLPVFHFSEQQRNAAFGVPFFVLLAPEQASTREGIYCAVVERCERWTRNKSDMWKYEDEDGFEIIGPQAELFDLKMFNSITTTGIETGFNMNAASVRWVDWDARERLMRPDPVVSDPESEDGAAADKAPPAPLLKPTDALVCSWDYTMQSHFFGPKSALFDWWEDFTHPEVQAVRDAQTKSRSGKRSIDLEDCLDEFTKEEQLGEDDLWYCPRCKKHQQATKKFELWSVPDILVVHLKRFSNARAMRDKIDALVEFPITRLDLNDRVGESEGECVYDLFAVDEHMRGLDGGHYRAYAKNLSDNEWYHFDDSCVTKSSAEDSINANAYLLFYRRRALDPKAAVKKVRVRIALNPEPQPEKSVNMVTVQCKHPRK